jgi:hypothetical protein
MSKDVGEHNYSFTCVYLSLGYHLSDGISAQKAKLHIRHVMLSFSFSNRLLP